jgi:hypothetical protein
MPKDTTETTETTETVGETPQEQEQQVIEMSIARALNEVKLLTKRINKISSQNSFVKTQKGEVGAQEPSNAVSFIETVNQLQALIERKAVIRNAISIANATTIITAGHYTLSIAAAISIKDGIEAQKQLLSLAEQNYKRAKVNVNNYNEDAERRLSSILEQNFGKDKRADSNDYDAIAGPFNKANLTKIVDEELILQSLEQYTTLIENFESEVDFALSEANATTKIKIPA